MLVIVIAGEPFRLGTRDGEVRDLSTVVAHHRSVEPLVEVGLRHGCHLIEYRRDDERVRVRVTR